MNKNAKERFDVDPILENISPHIPDVEINSLFPFRKFNTQGHRREFKSDQLYRAHILAMIKGILSFNKLCAEFKTRRSFREFCRFKNRKMTPTNRILSEFRDHLQPSGFEKIAQLMTLNFLAVVPLPRMKIAIPDGSDMPANCDGFAKKNANVLATANALKNIPLKEPPRVNGPRKAARVPILLDIRSIPYGFG
jgi:Transposase domain (DUF772)